MKHIFIDVREPEEFVLSHVSGAINIPLGELETSEVLNKLDSDEPIVVYCRSGNRSEHAKKYLKNIGYNNVVNGINQETIEVE